MKLQYLFVYGSLAPGKANGHILEPLDGNWQKAWVRGHLFVRGKRGTHGYPAFIPDDMASWQAGLLFSHRRISPAFWRDLDQFEGAGYSRTQVATKLTNQKIIYANIYAYRNATISHNCP